MPLDGPVTPGHTLRPTVRVLLLDEADRLLLFRMQALDGPIWCPAGGGVEPDETARQAAAREL
ncbi:MAG TPA: NUDIX hydrolase, partial [Mycobacteriales bacterium]|nr:NUDIX hydrolase [Mycobacteriales bacterium]